MIRLNDLASIERWPVQEQRALLLLTLERITQGEPYEASTHGFFLIVETEEGFDAIGDAIGRPVDYNSWEYLEEHADCYELVCVLSDDGFGVVVIVPKGVAVDSGLALLCTQGASRWTR